MNSNKENIIKASVQRFGGLMQRRLTTNSHAGDKLQFRTTFSAWLLPLFPFWGFTGQICECPTDNK